MKSVLRGVIFAAIVFMAACGGNNGVNPVPVTYTVVYNGNGNTGGSVPIDLKSPYPQDSVVTVLGAGNLVKANHTFGGWNTAANGNGVSYAAGDTFNIAANTTLYAIWTLNSYTVTWEVDGGTPVPTQTTVSHGGSITAPAAAITKAGHAFGGWFTDANFTSQVVTFPITNVTANTTLWARWTTDAYTVIWNADGGMPVPVQTTVIHGGSITAPAAITKTGHTFGGWFTDANFTSQVVTFPITNVTANTTLWARWTLNTYTITWNADGGAPIPTQTTVSHGGSIAAPVAMTKTGDVPNIAEWWTAETGGTRVSFPITNVTGNITLYARWVQGFVDLRDGKSYRTVLMPDGKTWMAENLNYVANSGVTVDGVGSWCYGNNPDSCAKYGRLYNWDAAMAACPAGWSLPTRQDWTNLVTVAGGRSVAGHALKAGSPAWDGNDTFGFSALPGGYRFPDGNFQDLGVWGSWWSASEDNAVNAWFVLMHIGAMDVHDENRDIKSHGLSVRCIRNP